MAISCRQHRLLTAIKVPMVARVKEETAMDSKAPLVGKEVVAAEAAMEDGVKVQITRF